MTPAESIIIGVVSGILASLLLFISSEFIRKIAIPWYQQMIYSGITISGDWKAEVVNPSGNTQTMTMDLKQKANKLTGTITVSKQIQSSKAAEIKNYSLEGTIRDRFVSLVGKNASQRNLGVHVELLEVVGDGETMQGKRTWYSATEKLVNAEDIIWKR